MAAVKDDDKVLAAKLASRYSVILIHTAMALGTWLEQHEKENKG